jgi:hypothetical protein
VFANSMPTPAPGRKRAVSERRRDAALRDQIESAALRGVPDVSAMIEHNGDIGR